MRRTDHEIIDLAEIESILKNATVCRIGMADGGEPYIVPLCFDYSDGKFTFIQPCPEKKLPCWRKIPGAVLRMTSVTVLYNVSSRVHRRCNTKA